jgi:hypothetical protein
VISLYHHQNEYVAIWYCHKHRIRGKTIVPTKLRTVAIRYCNNWQLPWKGTRHETSGVGIGYRHKCILPQMGFLRRFCRLLREVIPTKEIVASSVCCHEKKCGNLRHLRCNRTLSCHILVFVAITYYHACCRNAWQQTQCRGNRYLLRQFVTYCNECCCCNRPESL